MTTEIIEAGVDWLTCTWDAGMPASVATQIEADFHMATEGRQGKWLGYYGLTTTEAFFGAREDSSLLRLSSGSAFAYWHHYVQSAKNVSRLDVQVTVKLNFPNSLVAKELANSASSVRMGDANYPRLKLIDGMGNGDTFTMGDRSSDVYARVYDKEKESGQEGYAGCWRYELEYKGAKAKAVALQLLAMPSVPTSCIGLVLSYFHSHHLYPAVPPSGVPMRQPVIRRARDDERSLAWLTTQVFPTVARLIDNGHSEAVYSALGLRGNGEYGR